MRKKGKIKNFEYADGRVKMYNSFNNHHYFPSKGQHVVVVSMGDDRSGMPMYRLYSCDNNPDPEIGREWRETAGDHTSYYKIIGVYKAIEVGVEHIYYDGSKFYGHPEEYCILKPVKK